MPLPRRVPIDRFPAILDRLRAAYGPPRHRSMPALDELVLTVLSLNIFGDGLRDALDPRAKVRIER